jgi:hypothetical protein
MEDHVIMGEMLAALVVVTPEAIVLIFGLAEKDVKRSRHAKMHQQDVARGQIDQ